MGLQPFSSSVQVFHSNVFPGKEDTIAIKQRKILFFSLGFSLLLKYKFNIIIDKWSSASCYENCSHGRLSQYHNCRLTRSHLLTKKFCFKKSVTTAVLSFEDLEKFGIDKTWAKVQCPKNFTQLHPLLVFFFYLFSHLINVQHGTTASGKFGCAFLNLYNKLS